MGADFTDPANPVTLGWSDPPALRAGPGRRGHRTGTTTSSTSRASPSDSMSSASAQRDRWCDQTRPPQPTDAGVLAGLRAARCDPERCTSSVRSVMRWCQLGDHFTSNPCATSLRGWGAIPGSGAVLDADTAQSAWIDCDASWCLVLLLRTPRAVPPQPRRSPPEGRRSP